MPFMNLTDLYSWMKWVFYFETIKDRVVTKPGLTQLLKQNNYSDIFLRCRSELDVEIVCNVLIALRTEASKSQALEILTWAVEHTYMDSPFLLTKYVVYLCYMRENDSFAWMQIRLLMKRVVNLNPFLDTRYIFWYLMNKWELNATAYQTGELKRLHILDHFRFQNNICNARTHHALGLQAATNFWQTIKTKDKKTYKLYGIAETFYHHQRQAIWYYKCLIKQFPNSLTALRSYAMFIDECINNPEISSEVIEYANSIEDRTRMAQKNTDFTPIMYNESTSHVINSPPTPSPAPQPSSPMQHGQKRRMSLLEKSALRSYNDKTDSKSTVVKDEESENSSNSSSHHSSVSSSAYFDTITDFFEVDILTRRDRTALIKVHDLVRLLRLNVVALSCAVLILLFVGEFVFLARGVEDTLMIGLIGETRKASQAVFYQTRKLEMMALDPNTMHAPSELFERQQNSVYQAAKYLSDAYQNISLYTSFQEEDIKTAYRETRVQLQNQDSSYTRYSFKSLLNVYIQHGLAVSNLNLTVERDLAHNERVRFVLDNGVNVMLSELQEMLLSYKRLHRNRIKDRFVESMVLFASVFCLPVFGMLFFGFSSYRYIPEEATGVLKLFKCVHSKAAKSAVLRLKSKFSTTIDAINLTQGNMEEITALANVNRPERRKYLKPKWIFWMNLFAMILLVGWCCSIVELIIVEKEVLRKQAFEVDNAGARAMLTVRAVSFATELVRFDPLLWSTRDSIRDELRGTVERLMYTHLGLLYGNESLSLFGSYGRDAFQDQLLTNNFCPDLHNFTCLGLDASVFHFIDLGTMFSALPENLLSFDHPYLLEMQSMMDGSYMRMMELSRDLYAREIAKNAAYTASKVAYGLWFLLALIIYAYLQFPLELLSQRIKVARSILFLLSTDSIIESEDLRSYLMHGVLRSSQIDKEEREFEREQSKQNGPSLFERFQNWRQRNSDVQQQQQAQAAAMALLPNIINNPSLMVVPQGPLPDAHMLLSPQPTLGELRPIPPALSRRNSAGGKDTVGTAGSSEDDKSLKRSVTIAMPPIPKLGGKSFDHIHCEVTC
jgi:hypothetical protein